MTRRIAVILSDVHGNANGARGRAGGDPRPRSPTLVAVAGDLVLNGPDPSGAVDLLREMEADGAAIVSGNTDVAVADFDYAAAFPWMSDGVPDTFRAAAEWAHDELGTSGSPGCAGYRPSAGCAPTMER